MNSIAFERFKEKFDSFLAKDPPWRQEMLFLRYEGENVLLAPEQGGSTETQTLKEHLDLLQACENYVVSKEVTSTYVFFNPGKYRAWLDTRELADGPESRLHWARDEITQQVYAESTPELIWFYLINEPDWYTKIIPPHTED